MGGRGARSKHKVSNGQPRRLSKEEIVIEQLKKETGADEVIINETQYELKDFNYSYDNPIAQELLLREDEFPKDKDGNIDKEFKVLYDDLEIHEKIAVTRDIRGGRKHKLIPRSDDKTFDTVTMINGKIERTEYKCIKNQNVTTAVGRVFKALKQRGNRIVVDAFKFDESNICEMINRIRGHYSDKKLPFDLEVNQLNITFIFKKEV